MSTETPNPPSEEQAAAAPATDPGTALASQIKQEEQSTPTQAQEQPAQPVEPQVKEEQQESNAVAAAETPAAAPSAAAAAAAAAGEGPIRFENALQFLDRVKLQFADRPQVYNQFLEIMRDFKTKAIDTPGVILRVRELFHEHPQLVLGFNTFLPPGFKITLPAEKKKKKTPSAPAAAASPAGATGEPERQPEFDHARNFVKKIKTRFSMQPAIYKSFLEILHLYHKGAHNIRDVYAQVAKLFAAHPDLLDEFTEFLPETLPQQKSSKRRTNKRKTSERSRKAQTAAATAASSAARRKNKRRATAREREREEEEAGLGARAADRERRESREREEAIGAEATKAQHKFFEELRTCLSGNTLLYQDFLKCLQMYSSNLVRAADMLAYAKEMLREHPDLLERFRRFLMSSQGIKAPRSVGTPHFTEINFSSLPRYGASYRALPKQYRNAICTGRTPADQMVLNDVWVNVPTGFEDEPVVFRGSLKNQFEEVLFQCEDDRYELDLVIELNASAIRALEPLRERIANLKDEELASFKMPTRLDVLHERSIERVYGEQGPAMLEALYENPVWALPVILRRLKQKDIEWSRNMAEWDRIWREVAEKNQLRALDYQSGGFKDSDRQNYSAPHLLSELYTVHQQRLSTAPEDNTYHLGFKLPDLDMLNDVYQLLVDTVPAEDARPKLEVARVEQFFDKFLGPLLQFERRGAAAGQGEEGGEQSSKRRKGNNRDPEIEGAVAAPVVTLAQDGGQEATPHVFLANKTIYVFLRVLLLLCERLKSASAPPAPVPGAVAPVGGPPESDAERAEKYQRILGLVSQLVKGEIEQPRFEDALREMFGLHAYRLFTLNSVVQVLRQQLLILLNTDQSIKLLGLWEYQQRTKRSENEYVTNARELVGPTEPLVRVCFEQVAEFGQDPALTFRMMRVSNQPQIMGLTRVDGEWSDYMHEYVHGLEPKLKHHNVFLLRNKKQTFDSMEEALQSTALENGLMARIALNTYKMVYLQDTEDFFFRKPRHPAAPEPNLEDKRAKRFHSWASQFV